jgi:hypothetical protein
MTAAVGALNLLLGFVYIQYGTLTLIEMRRNWRQMGFSHFGAAWIAMAFTCGPHHFAHGLHLLIGGHQAGSLDLLAVIIGFPAAVIWFALRMEALRGGRGDRFISGSPLWVLALPTVFGMYLTAMLAAVIARGVGNPAGLAVVAPNVLLIVIYAAIAYFLVRTQIVNRRPLGGWSVSGLALACIFPTCSIMHAVYAYYSLSGSYPLVLGGAVIDWLAVPAGVYFLWVVHALYKGTFLDWNRTKAMLEESAIDDAPIGEAVAA